MPPSPLPRLTWPDDALLASFGAPLRCLSSAPLNGGLAVAEHWLALQVGSDEVADDPGLRVASAALDRGLDPRRVVGVVTGADVRAGVRRDHRPATAVATVGADVNVFVVVASPLTDAALVAAVQGATEAAAQALAAARGGRADRRACAGAAGMTVCVAAPPVETGTPRWGGTAIGAALALAVHSAVRSGARIHRRTAMMLGES